MLLIVVMTAPPSSAFMEQLLKGSGSNFFWGGSSFGIRKQEESKQRQTLKELLFQECSESSSTSTSRERVQDLIQQLAPLSPTRATASSPLLQRNWSVLYTTEKEINVFVEWGIAASRGSITQKINSDGVLQNCIPFARGGSLSVSGDLQVDNESDHRTNFVFTTATLDLGSWGCYQLPPVGKGWFDTIYLDQDLRIDENSRNDILICTPVK